MTSSSGQGPLVGKRKQAVNMQTPFLFKKTDLAPGLSSVDIRLQLCQPFSVDSKPETLQRASLPSESDWYPLSKNE